MNWQLKPKPPEDFIAQFPEYSPLVLQLLYSRGIREQKAIDEFFNPDYKEDLHDPFLMLGMRQAVSRALEAAAASEKVAIFGDYDADGVCGAVILKIVLDKIGVNLSGGIYIPDRKVEGYGLNLDALKKLADDGVKLIITVDCGISDAAEIEYANSLGMETIILDHHNVGKKLPPAYAIVDPCQENEMYPFRALAGAGVAFKFAQALLKSFKFPLGLSSGRRQVSGFKLNEGWEKWLLDLVAIATVADCVPLLGENRTLVRYGLFVLAQTPRPGLQELMKIARLSPIFEAETLKTNLDAYSLGFVLAPRLNAAGRVNHASLAFELLLEGNRIKARERAEKIEEQNRLRQKITADIVEEVARRVNSIEFDGANPVIVEADANWSAGVIGLVAGKIADRYHRPAFIFRQNGDNTLRGSARSVASFNIIEAIAECADLLEEFGGHPGAAGLSLREDNLEEFTKRINRLARAKLKDEDLVPVVEIDLELEACEVNWQLFDDLSKFEPFGQDNRQPKFLIKNLEISGLRFVGAASQHLKMDLRAQDGADKIFKAIGFGLAKNGNRELQVGDRIDIVAEVIIDEWNGNRELQLRIADIRKVESANIKN